MTKQVWYVNAATGEIRVGPNAHRVAVEWFREGDDVVLCIGDDVFHLEERGRWEH